MDSGDALSVGGLIVIGTVTGFMFAPSGRGAPLLDWVARRS
jgi:hypothetical protein